MTIIFCLLASVLIWLSYRSFRGGVDYLRFFKQELKRMPSDFTPFVTVFAPCRGLDQHLEENLQALVAQNYPEFEVIFVVDDRNDPAVAVIVKLLDGNVRMVLAPKAVGSGQKVENLRTAVKQADPRSRAFAFVDSDVRVSDTWLRDLIEPLNDPNIGAATGYRWFLSRNPTFASELRSSWNASIASALGPETKSNFCWGGSTAIRREVFERLGIHEKWQGTLSDDFTVTRAIKEAKLPIVFVPKALTASLGDCDFAEMLEFTTRQMKITRAYARHLWLSSLIGSGLFVSVMVAAFFILVFSDGLFFRVAAAITITAVSFFSAAKAWTRLEAVRLVLLEYGPALKRQRLAQCTLWLISPAVFLYNSLAALFSRRLTWRGIVYELKSPAETVIISD